MIVDSPLRHSRPEIRAAVALAYLFSGFSALSYQVVWQRVLTQEMGADSVSVGFIVTIFMAGLGHSSSSCCRSGGPVAGPITGAAAPITHED